MHKMNVKGIQYDLAIGNVPHILNLNKSVRCGKHINLRIRFRII